MHIELWDKIHHYVALHPEQGLILAVLVAFLEALPIIGTIFPGSITMTVIGIFAGRGLISTWETLLWTTFGAFVGDCIGFFFGRLFHKQIPNRWPFKSRPHWLQKGREFFDKHGGKSVIIGRFIGPARSTVPMVAGLMRMSVGRFIAAAIPSALFWAFVYLLPGILIGAVSLQLSPAKTTLFLLMGLCVVVFLWGVFWLVQRFFVLFSRGCNSIISRWWQALSKLRATKHCVSWIARADDPQNHRPLTRLLCALLCLLVYIILQISVLSHNVLTHINMPLFNLAQSFRHLGLDKFFVAVTILGGASVIGGVTVLVTVGMLFARDWRRARFWLIAMAVAIIWAGLTKLGLYEPRPVGFYRALTTSSFPSAHTALSLVCYGLLVYWGTQFLECGWRMAWRAVAIVIIVLIALSRLYLGAHWFLDVFAGAMLGMVVWLVTTTLYRRKSAKDFPSRFKTYSWLFATLVLIWAVGILKSYDSKLYGFTPIEIRQTVSLEQWLGAPLNVLPTYRDDRLGKPIEPFNVQWVGNKSEIVKMLLRDGWKSVGSRWTTANIVRRFATHEAEDNLPLVRSRYRMHLPAVDVIKKINNTKKLVELRLWPSGVAIVGADDPVWIGTVNYRLPRQKALTIKQQDMIDFAYGAAALYFIKPIKSAYRVRVIKSSAKRASIIKK